MRTIALAFILAAQSAHCWTLVTSLDKGWESRSLKIFVNPAKCPIPENQLLEIVDKSIGVWNQSPHARIHLERASEFASDTVVDFIGGRAKQTPVILCDPNIGKNNDGVDADYVPALTRVSASDDHLDYGGVLLNAEAGASANIARLRKGQLHVTLSHELGHVLGLGHSSSTEALMYYSIRNKTDPKLSQDDIQGLSYLYPVNEIASQPFGCAAAHDANREREGWGIVGLFVIANFLLGRWWVRRFASQK